MCQVDDILIINNHHNDNNNKHNNSKNSNNNIDKNIYTCLCHSYIQNKNLERQGDRHVMTHIRSSERLGLWQPDRPNLQDVPCHVKRSSCGWRSFSGSSSRPRQWTLSCYMCIYDYLWMFLRYTYMCSWYMSTVLICRSAIQIEEIHFGHVLDEGL